MEPARRARVGLLAVFGVNGALFASWVSRIPQVRATVGASEGELGLLLLCVVLGAFAGMPAAARASSRYGSRRTSAVAAWSMCAALGLPGLAGGLVPLGLALLALGAANGAIDVAMNAQAVTVEAAARRPWMPSFHAAWSLGGLVGAGLGGVAAEAGVPVAVHLALVGAVGAVVVGRAVAVLLADGRQPVEGGGSTQPRPRRSSPDAALLVLGAVAFGAAVGEGSIADWSALYLADDLSAGPGAAAAGFAIFSGFMALGRVVGSRAVASLGAERVLAGGAGVAALGLAGALTASSVPVALGGFALVGVGLSCAFPIALSAAGARGGSGSIAAVSAIGYTGFLGAPPVIGAVAERTSVGGALWLVVGLSVVSVAVARVARPALARAPTSSDHSNAPDNPAASASPGTDPSIVRLGVGGSRDSGDVSSS